MPGRKQAKSRLEALLSMASGAVAEPVAGLAGLLGLATGGARRGADAVEKTRSALTYQPRDPSALQELGRLIEPITSRIEQGKRYLGDSAYNATGSPALAAAAYTAPEGLAALLGLRGAGMKGPTMQQMAQRTQGPTAGSPAAQLGIFAGQKARTADHGAMQRAAARLAAGDDPRVVWREEGWMRGPDGGMRFEIDDSQARGRDYQYTPQAALNEARDRAIIDGDAAGYDRAQSMAPYAGKTKNQLVGEYRTTGGEIVDAAKSGDMDLAKRLLADRGGLDALLSQMGDRRYGPLSAYLKHGDIGQAYPDVYRMHTRLDPEMDRLGGYMSGSPYQGEQIALKERPWSTDGRSVALHEIQHAVQNREGFARGGTPGSAVKAAQAQEFNTEVYTPHDLYERLAGEAEARAVQKRMDYTPEQRRAIYPLDDYDVPLDELIFRRGGGGVEASSPLAEYKDFLRQKQAEYANAQIEKMEGVIRGEYADGEMQLPSSVRTTPEFAQQEISEMRRRLADIDSTLPPDDMLELTLPGWLSARSNIKGKQ